MRGRRGITLLEILIAAAIMAVAFIPLTRLVGFGTTSQTKTSNLSRATRLAQELIEECKHVPVSTYGEVATYKAAPALPAQKMDIMEDLYPKTKASIAEFVAQNAKSIKDFKVTAQLQLVKTGLNQIKEIWFFVEIEWVDKGTIDQGNPTRRMVRAGNALFNPEAM